MGVDRTDINREGTRWRRSFISVAKEGKCNKGGPERCRQGRAQGRRQAGPEDRCARRKRVEVGPQGLREMWPVLALGQRMQGHERCRRQYTQGEAQEVNQFAPSPLTSISNADGALDLLGCPSRSESTGGKALSLRHE